MQFIPVCAQKFLKKMYQEGVNIPFISLIMFLSLSRVSSLDVQVYVCSRTPFSTKIMSPLSWWFSATHETELHPIVVDLNQASLLHLDPIYILYNGYTVDS